jgi:hypothetical protein
MDLDIIKPNTSNELEEDLDDIVGEVVNINFDDDDGDGGIGYHGQTDIVSDKDDSDGVSGEDDLIELKVHDVDCAGFTGLFKIEYNDAKMKLWKQNNKSDPIISDTTEIDTTVDTSVFVEGISAHGNMDGEFITLKLIKDGATLNTDKVKIIGADMIFAVFGTNECGKGTLISYLDNKKKYVRTASEYFDFPAIYVLEGNNKYYSVAISNTEKGFKTALLQTDATSFMMVTQIMVLVRLFIMV